MKSQAVSSVSMKLYLLLLIFMQNHKLLDDKLNEMEIKDFVETTVFKALFAVDTSIRSRKNPIRTVENSE